MVFQQKHLGKAYFIIKITAPAMIWPVSSNKWKAPLDGCPWIEKVVTIWEKGPMLCLLNRMAAEHASTRASK